MLHFCTCKRCNKKFTYTDNNYNYLCEDCREDKPILLTNFPMMPIIPKSETPRKLSDRDIKNLKRIKAAIRNKVPHFAPTISPAPKYKNEIESLEAAMRYYHGKGIKLLIIQPKHMGSYCDIELHSNIENTRFFSRNGNLIQHLDRDLLIKAVTPIHKMLNWNGISKYLIQSELVPWSAMGKRLIENEFKTYGYLVEQHLNYLKQSSIYLKIDMLRNSDEYKKFIENKSNKDYPSHIKRTYEAIQNFYKLDIPAYEEGLNEFNNQLQIHGQEYEDYMFMPFNLLKMYYENGEEYVNDSNATGYLLFNRHNQNYLLIDLEKTDLEESIRHAYNYYNDLVNRGYEGVVVKPDEIYMEGLVPMFKVRNNNYLTMIYGVNFKLDYEYYLKKRRIDKKQNSSINQWKISQYLLRIKDKDINQDNKHYIDLIEKRIQEEEFESTIDNRL